MVPPHIPTMRKCHIFPLYQKDKAVNIDEGTLYYQGMHILININSTDFLTSIFHTKPVHFPQYYIVHICTVLSIMTLGSFR